MVHRGSTSQVFVRLADYTGVWSGRYQLGNVRAQTNASPHQLVVVSLMQFRRVFEALLLLLILAVSTSSQGILDPYGSLTPEQKALLKPSIERYIDDQIREKWSDLWEIQDQTSDLKNELLLGNRNAPDMTREQFVKAMKETIGTGFPRLNSFRLRSVNPDKERFVVTGCAKASRESWHQTSLVNVWIKIVNGKPRFDIWELTADPCSDK
jgi:hypothetical protein